eukprot:TRINITY_DN2005_c2_g1_i2.p1 TRINITY_DN2005_c2_g1~~TRINITY_DN2005_c2_g1_i2.p1  ORF type:complete len:310 (+),score=59.64 TRINITY_DN2005_c2_g1_i2:281-1210(+)
MYVIAIAGAIVGTGGIVAPIIGLGVKLPATASWGTVLGGWGVQMLIDVVADWVSLMLIYTIIVEGNIEGSRPKWLMTLVLSSCNMLLACNSVFDMVEAIADELGKSPGGGKQSCQLPAIFNLRMPPDVDHDLQIEQQNQLHLNEMLLAVYKACFCTTRAALDSYRVDAKTHIEMLSAHYNAKVFLHDVIDRVFDMIIDELIQTNVIVDVDVTVENPLAQPQYQPRGEYGAPLPPMEHRMSQQQQQQQQEYGVVYGQPITGSPPGGQPPATASNVYLPPNVACLAETKLCMFCMPCVTFRKRNACSVCLT